MNILVNGGSISQGPGSWPYLVQEHFNADIVNLAQAGSGNSYVCQTTIAELAQRNYDLVLVQWTPFIRFDYKVKNIELFNNTIFTSDYQSNHNDWPGKVIHPINDQDLVEKDWIFGGGRAMNHDPDIELTDAFLGFYKYAGPSEYMYHALMLIISLQSYLKVNKVPYLFCFGREWKLFDRFKHLNDQIDQSNVFTKEYIYTLAEKNQWHDTDGHHPNLQAHQEFAKLITPEIEKILQRQ
jgi:hypothetical protein